MSLRKAVSEMWEAEKREVKWEVRWEIMTGVPTKVWVEVSREEMTVWED